MHSLSGTEVPAILKEFKTHGVAKKFKKKLLKILSVQNFAVTLQSCSAKRPKQAERLEIAENRTQKNIERFTIDEVVQELN